MKKPVVLAAIALAGVLWIAGSALADPDRATFDRLHGAEDRAGVIRVMSFNTYFLFDTEDDPAVETDQDHCPSNYDAKMGSLVRVIGANDPDVLGLQEVENRKVVDELASKLPKRYEVLHFESRDEHTGQDVALLYDPARLEAAGTMRDNLEWKATLRDRWGKPLIKEQTLTKGILEMQLKIRDTGEKVVFCVTHLKSQIGGFPSDLQRYAQALAVRQRVEQIVKRYNDRVVLLGDFNDFPGSPTLEILTGDTSFRKYEDNRGNMVLWDVLAKYVPPEQLYTFVQPRFIQRDGQWAIERKDYLRMDFILASPAANEGFVGAYVYTGLNIEKGLPSDHYPIVADYRIARGGE